MLYKMSIIRASFLLHVLVLMLVCFFCYVACTGTKKNGLHNVSFYIIKSISVQEKEVVNVRNVTHQTLLLSWEKSMLNEYCVRLPGTKIIRGSSSSQTRVGHVQPGSDVKPGLGRSMCASKDP